jgi:hypothetical protein
VSTLQQGNGPDERRVIYPFEAESAAYKVLRQLICERPPFERWRPEESLIPEDLDDDFQLAVMAYALSVYLYLIKEKFGLAESEKTRAHILVLSNFDKTIESRLPIFLEAIRSASASRDQLFGDSIDDPEARTYWSLAAFISTAAKWPQNPKTLVRESPLLKGLVKCLVVAKADAYEVLGREICDAEVSSEPHRWNDQPGPFERQVQRQEMNPLFPAEQRKISPLQIQQARTLDLTKAFAFLLEFRPFRQQMLSLKDQLTVKQLSAFLKHAVDLTVPCAWLGPYFSTEMKQLEAVIDPIEKELTKAITEPSFQEGLKDYRALIDVQKGVPMAISETMKELGIDSNELWIRSVFTEDEAAIWALGAFVGVTKLDCWKTARDIVDFAVREGLPIEVAKRKLQVFREGIDSQTPKTGSRFWKATRNFFQKES